MAETVRKRQRKRQNRCPICDGPPSPGSRFCSAQHKARFALIEQRQEEIEVERRCQWCEKEIPATMRRHAKFCCSSHRALYWDAKKRGLLDAD